MSNDGSKMTDETTRQCLSDVMDGQADDASVLRACAAWRSDAQVRADWHAYHVIGDVLRTPELAPKVHTSTVGADGVSDAAFLAALRTRLAREPVVLAPAAAASAVRSAPPSTATPGVKPTPPDFQSPFSEQSVGRTSSQMTTDSVAGATSRSGWRGPAAVAAGFLAVVGVVITQMGGLGMGSSGPQLASSKPAGQLGVSPAAAVVQATALAPAPGKTQPSATILINDQRMVRDANLDRYLAAHRQFGDGPVGAVPGGVVRGVSTWAPDR